MLSFFTVPCDKARMWVSRALSISWDMVAGLPIELSCIGSVHKSTCVKIDPKVCQKRPKSVKRARTQA
jgi:hypothetical protein